ncbi:MAG: hypothetical protein FWH27_11310, partial [Planctomycetaceae bacterium]|nr:hypothetical protein [Planctomycetaceae bacterium]
MMIKTSIIPCVLLFLVFNTVLMADDNLARTAKVAATSVYSSQYEAKFAVDGVIPGEASQGADLGHAWCVRGESARDTADFTLAWDEPVAVGQVVYFGRTSWFV